MRAKLTSDWNRTAVAIIVVMALSSAPFGSFGASRCIEHSNAGRSVDARVALEAVVPAAVGEELTHSGDLAFEDAETHDGEGCCIQNCSACVSPILTMSPSIPTSSGSQAPHRLCDDVAAGLSLPPTLDPPRPVA